MNKHIKKYSERLYENIGRGSVVLIKGRPTPNGRRLYATTITGYAEIKPGLAMVFLGDQIYQVLYKEEKFFGAKVDYVGEDGLKGVLNLKNPGSPSLVLNHNKTPYHWMTLKHLDIGSALRELGHRLFDHELILESDELDMNIEGEGEEQEDMDTGEEGEVISPEKIITFEFMKLITGEPSIILINQVDQYGADSYSYEITSDEDDGDGRSYTSDYDWSLSYDISINGDSLNSPDVKDFAERYEEDRKGIRLIKYIEFTSMFGTPYDNSKSGLSIDLEFQSDIRSYSTFHRGGYMEPDEWEHVNSELDHELKYIYIDGEDMSDDPEIRKYIDKINNIIKNEELPEIYNKIIGINLLTKI
jgi:hypothetical protein